MNRLLAIVAVVGVLGIDPSHVLAADAYWDINGAAAGAGGATPAGTWDSGTPNWGGLNGNVATTTWVADDTAFFAAAGDATGAYTVTLDTAQSASGLNFEEGTVTISGTGDLTLNGAAGADVAGTALGTINSILSGNLGLTKTGAGTLTLGGTNTYTGVTNVNTGILAVTSVAGLGGTTDGTTVADGASLDVNGAITEPIGISGNGSTGTNGALFKSGAAVTVASPITLNANARINNSASGTLTLTGGITNGFDLTVGGTNNITVSTVALSGAGTLTKDGANTLTLSGAHTYTGTTTVNAGILAVSNATGLGTTAGTTTVNSGGTLQVSGGVTIAETISIAGTGSTGTNGALRKTGANTTTLSGAISGDGLLAVTAGTLTLTANNGSFTGPILVNGGGRLSVNAVTTGGTTGLITLDNGIIRNTNGGNAGSFISSSRNINLGAGGGTLEWAGDTTDPIDPTFLIIVQTGTVISGTAGGTLHKTGAGIISVVTPATYDGPTHVAAGTLRVRTNNNVYPIGTALTVDAGAIFDLNGLTQAVGSVAGDGTVNTGSGLFTNGSSNASTTFAGQFTEATGGVGGRVTKQGTGTLTLSGSSSHSGLTTISAGAIRVQNIGALGTAAGATTVASGAALEIDGTGLSIAEPLTITGNGISSTGAVRNLANDNSLSGAIALSGNARLHSDAGKLTVTGTVKSSTATARNLTLSGAGNIQIDGIIGDGANPIGNLTKSGGGTATLTTVNTYAGNTTVSAGTLSITNQFLPDASDVLLTTGATLNLNFPVETPDVIDSLFIDGVSQATGTWGALLSAADHTSALITGTGWLSVTTFVPPVLLGDFDSNNIVDARDYVTWRENDVANGGSGGALPNDNGAADQTARYSVWKANFGNTLPGASAGLSGGVGVPEPGSLLLGLLAVVAVEMCARRRRR